MCALTFDVVVVGVCVCIEYRSPDDAVTTGGKNVGWYCGCQDLMGVSVCEYWCPNVYVCMM